MITLHNVSEVHQGVQYTGDVQYIGDIVSMVEIS